jgi:pimeloyl-ACP methyl ester carboxylesterase
MTVRHSSVEYIDEDTFQADVAYLETLFKRHLISNIELPLINIGQGLPLVFVPMLENLEFIYARQLRFFSQQRRVILYRRHETRTHFTSLRERAEELHLLLNHLEIMTADFIGHGDAAMILLEFAIRYPQRCRSLTIVSQGAESHVPPQPWVWLFQELYLRLPLEHVLPASFLRRTVVNSLVARQGTHACGELQQILPRAFIDDQFEKIKIWPSVYKFSVLPVTHRFNIRKRLQALEMPILLLNGLNDSHAPETSTRWLANHLPNCADYHLVPGGERFFLYSQAESVNQIIQDFLARLA